VPQKTRIPYVPKDTPVFQDLGPRLNAIETALGLPPGGMPYLSETWIIFLEKRYERDAADKAEPAAGGAGELKATFGINRELNITDPSLTFQPFIARDFAEAKPFRLLRVAPWQPPSGSTARCNIDISKDEGASWYSILDTEGVGYFELAADDATRQDFTGIFRSDEYGSIEDGDFLRINCSQVGSSYPGKNIEFVLWFDEADA